MITASLKKAINGRIRPKPDGSGVYYRDDGGHDVFYPSLATARRRLYKMHEEQAEESAREVWKLPCQFSAKQLVVACRFFRDHPNSYWRFDDWTEIGDVRPAAQFPVWFREKLTEKIASKMPHYGKGHKWGDGYQVDLMRMGRYVGNRIVIDWISPALGPRVREAFRSRLRSENL